MAEAQYVQWLSATNPTAQVQTIKALAWGIQEGQRRQEEQQRATEAAANVPSNSSGSAIRGTASTAGLLPGRADWETRKALLKDLVGIPEYLGQFKDDAARKWILACERHFQDVEGLTEVEISDTQKIIAAKSNLRKAAEDRWRVMYGRKSIQGMQWEEFKTWVEEQFSEYLSPEKRYAKYRRMTQGNQTPFHKYAADLRQAADDLEFRNMSEDLMIADLIHGAKADLQVRWHALPKHPTEWNAVVKAFVGLEEGATRGHAVSITGDPMDLSYMQGAPLGSTSGRKKEFKQTSEKKGKQVRRALRKRITQAYLFLVQPTQDEAEGSEFKLVVPHHDDSRVREILLKHQKVFPEELPKELPPERDHAHEVDTGDANPVNINAYPLSVEKLDELGRQIEDLIQKGLIQPSASPWGFPVVFVRKPDNKWRMCIDYRALNEVTLKNGYPLPRVQELLDIIGKAKFLSKIDLASGYWQVRMEESAIPKTAFNTVWGKFEWLAMPFGLCNAPATFQTLMNQTLQPLLGKCVVVYLDDILIFSESMNDHYRHLDQVLQLLEQQQLYARPQKCIFATQQLEFCGHIVGNGTVRTQPEKIKVIQEWPRPRNVHEVRQFLGLATYYRRFIRSFARIAAPLHELLKEADAQLRVKKFRPVRWNTAAGLAFRNLKEAMVTAPVLMQPDRLKPFIIETDASEWAIGFVLYQEGEDQKLHPVAFDGRKLSTAELNYPVHEKELLAIKEALRLWDRYIENGTTTRIITDHASLQYLQTTKTYSKRLARWVDEFQQYDLKIQYRKGSEAVVPDAISRRPDFVEDTPANIAQDRPDWVAQLNTLTVGDFSEQDWLKATEEFLRSGHLPTNKKLSRYVRKFAPHLGYRTVKLPMRADADTNRQLVFTHADGVVAPYLEMPLREDFVRRMHEEFGHLGYPGLQGVTRPRAWWPTIRTDIQETVKRCPNCQVAQGLNESLERETAQHLVKEGIRPFERWGIDLVGRLPKTPNGNQWIITAIDYATGWTVARAVPDATEETIGQFLHEDIFIQYGAPREIITDNGRNLIAKAVEYYIKLLKAKHRTTTPYHPRTNGKVENFNGILGRMLTKYLMGKPTRLWDEYLPQALFAARVHEHSVLGVSPYYLVYGEHPRIPSDENSEWDDSVGPFQDWEDRVRLINHARSKANELLLNRAIKTQRIRDEAVTKTSFKPGQWVLLRNEYRQKLDCRWYGPYQILKAHPLGTYALAEPGGRVLRNLINGARLIEAQVDNPDRLWTSSLAKRAIQKAGYTLHKPQEIRKILDSEEPTPPSYSELSTITRAEWEARERSGEHSVSVGEDEAITERVISKKRMKQQRTVRAVKSSAAKGPAKGYRTTIEY
ncbi:hypothetical protein N7532_011273 [Penicillium argentinense]|uniref:Reverse transcriptase n=1 Tax=Penicillium argentinense TaxID=1131581 RepID=A0A9W9JUT1_9EURO|nr:uncharacterized protein N7532_011273 [Penicillium argentinense]KAJ5082230.1 hypothetical protein N7532_011273 [Penicillium argentinense]